jgi:Acetyltransferase (GNAT) domain
VQAVGLAPLGLGHARESARAVVVRLGRDGTPRRRRNRPRRLLRAAARPRGDRNGGLPGEGPRGVRRALAAAARGRLAREADDRRRPRRGREHQCWEQDGRLLVGYWVGREFWGRGLATAALAELVAEIPERPLHAWVASSNVGSIRVLEKCGFVEVERRAERDDQSGEVIEEILYRLD